jgi:hypothetical protein
MRDRKEIAVSGEAIRATFDALREPAFGFTEEEIEKTIATLPPSQAKALSGKILPHEYRPETYEALNELVIACAQARRKKPEEFARELGREAARFATHRALKLFSTLLGPQRIVSFAAQLWQKQYRPAGQLVVAAQTTNSARFDLLDFPSHPIGCARITGWFFTLAAAANAKDLTVTHDPCVGKGADRCVWEFRWK